ncbi:ESPR-type extended signal peptide-containing protein, partial [Burkholderia cepacia]
MNRTYRSIWNEALGAWVAASEHDSARGKPNKSAVMVAAVAALVISLPGLAEANTINTQQTCLTGSNGAVGRVNPGGTQNQAGDGSGTYSVVAGCNSNGNGFTGVTVYGAFAQANGNGAVAMGIQSSAALWGVATGLETTASGIGATALGFGSTAAALNSVAIGGAGGNGTTPLSQANSTIASGAGSIAIGSNATKGAQSAASDSIAVGGQSSVASAATSGIALGRGATVNGAYGIAQGDGIVSGATGQNVAIGSSGTTANSGSANGGAVAIGRAQTASGDGAVALGTSNSANGTGAVALGNGNSANGT